MVAIFQIMCTILVSIGTLIKKVIEDSSYLWFKTYNYEMYNSGFPKEACQVCHISEGAP